MNIIDISPLISSEIAVWPGDVPFSRKILLNTDEGHHLTLSSIETSVHLGAHTDGPNHYINGGQDISQRSLSYYFGPAQVITCSTKRSERIHWQDLATHKIEAPRVLLKTNSFPNPNHFNEDFCSLSEELVDKLAERHAVLVGIDTPSVDPFNSKQLEAHHRIAKHNMAVLEGIILSHVQDGNYQLVALPLKIAGADASPVRAVLVK